MKPAVTVAMGFVEPMKAFRPAPSIASPAYVVTFAAMKMRLPLRVRMIVFPAFVVILNVIPMKILAPV